MIYSSWDIEQHILKLVILTYFFPFYPPKNPKNQNFEKRKKAHGDNIILHICTINYNMMYGSWDMECDTQNFLSLWTVFCPFTLLRTQKIKILKNEKKHWRYYQFTHVYHKWQSYDVWFLRNGVWQTDFFVILDLFLHFYPS